MNKIKEARKAKNMTQVQLAMEVGVTENAIQNYEANKRVPNANIIKRILKALDKKFEEIF